MLERQHWYQTALEASERSVRAANRLLRLACARHAAGLAPIGEVWERGELLVRELKTQLEIAHALRSNDWSELASARLQHASQELANLRQAHEQGLLHPSDVFFTELEVLSEAEPVREIPQEGMTLPFS